MIKDSWQQILGRRIRQRRLSEVLSQREFGKKAGVDQAQVSRFERGNFEKASQNLHQICKFWSVSMDVTNPVEVRTGLDQLAKLHSLDPEAAQAVDTLVRALTHELVNAPS